MSRSRGVTTATTTANADPAATRLECLELSDPRWRGFVASTPEATPFHHPAWARLLSETYRYPAFAAVVAGEDGAPLAGMPMLAVRGLRRRVRWIGLPFTDECAVLARDSRARAALLDALPAAAHAADADRVELRCGVDRLGWSTEREAVIHVLELDDLDRVRARFSRSQVTRNIKRAEREGVVVRRADSRADLESFYALHTRTRRRQGVPVQPRRFFDGLWSALERDGLGTVLLASAGGPPIAGAVFLHWNAATIYKFGASDPEGWPARPNHAIFWTAIRDAIGRGDRSFDFGRTDADNAGLRAFKAGWGAQERPLEYSARGNDHGEGLVGRLAARAIQDGPDWICRAAGETLYRYAASR